MKYAVIKVNVIMVIAYVSLDISVICANMTRRIVHNSGATGMGFVVVIIAYV